MVSGAEPSWINGLATNNELVSVSNYCTTIHGIRNAVSVTIL
ncbi:MAG: hypothetical protein ABI921_11580 [Panacibacter sp.]